jgi:adenine phosphoribosyltransferase
MTSDLQTRLRSTIAEIPDFPEEGVLYRDITPILEDHGLFRELIYHFCERYSSSDLDRIAAIESRGFLFGSAIAHELGVGLSLVRKPGKLPREVHRVEYELEYGTDALEIHTDALESSDRVLVVDDLLATGGTAGATVELVEACGADLVEMAFVIELADLGGREHLDDYDVHSIVTYD